MPHAPQFIGSVVVETQAPLHRINPGGQLSVHTPPTQMRPAPQRLPQVPQFSRSVIKVAHTLPHSTWVGGQRTCASPPTTGEMPEHEVRA